MDQNIKQQIVESINGTTNVLVTVSSNPSVDELAACIGLTLILNKLGKHATAVFSGRIPSTIEFLKPDETLEKDTNSLRDFIIALDKSKADKLRYKVEDEVVKIFITPYKTSISQKDLEFSQGDFNVDVVIAIGVHKREELDKAIVAHGRILHDATVVCLNNEQVSNLGVYNWQDAEASSLCEMVVDLGETIQPDNFDAQTATALLTGIVAETARFSNEKTSPRTMSLSAKLMAAGANQQLVASKLQTNLDKSQVAINATVNDEPDEEDAADGTLRIAHTSDDDDDKPDENPFSEEQEEKVEEPIVDEPVTEEPLEEPESPKRETRLKTTAEEEAEAAQSTEPIELPQQPVVELPSLPNELQSEEQLAPQINDIKTGTSEGAPAPESPQLPTVNPMKPGGSRLAYDAPVMGGTLTANSRPEQLDPATDGLNLPTPMNAPILNHAPSTVGQNDKPLMDEETLTHIEKSVGSEHAADAAQPVSSAQPPDIDQIRDAVQDAASDNEDPNRLEPLVASGSTPFDLNVQDNQNSIPPLPPNDPLAAPQDMLAPMPAAPSNDVSSIPEAPNMDFPEPAAPTAMPPEPPEAHAPSPSVNDILATMAQSDAPGITTIAPNPTIAPVQNNLPPQIVPSDPGLPPEQTASNMAQPLAPPPVPPPILPPSPGYPPANQGPQQPYPPAPGQ